MRTLVLWRAGPFDGTDEGQGGGDVEREGFPDGFGIKYRKVLCGWFGMVRGFGNGGTRFRAAAEVAFGRTDEAKELHAQAGMRLLLAGHLSQELAGGCGLKPRARGFDE